MDDGKYGPANISAERRRSGFHRKGSPGYQEARYQNHMLFEDAFREDLPGIDQLQEIDLSGKHATTLCFNNLNYRNFLLRIVEDWSRAYDIDGIMWCSERQGVFSEALGASQEGGASSPRQVSCFCPYCETKARQRGINPERARQGFLELAKYVDLGRKGQRPVDGYYVELWRLMLRYPELLAWEMLWTDSLRETYAAIYQHVKGASFPAMATPKSDCSPASAAWPALPRVDSCR